MHKPFHLLPSTFYQRPWLISHQKISDFGLHGEWSAGSGWNCVIAPLQSMVMARKSVVRLVCDGAKCRMSRYICSSSIPVALLILNDQGSRRNIVQSRPSFSLVLFFPVAYLRTCAQDFPMSLYFPLCSPNTYSTRRLISRPKSQDFGPHGEWSDGLGGSIGSFSRALCVRSRFELSDNGAERRLVMFSVLPFSIFLPCVSDCRCPSRCHPRSRGKSSTEWLI